MKSHELYLTAWFLGRIGNGQSVSLEEIKDYARYSRSNALLFKSNYDAWVRSVRNDAKRLGFFDPASKKGKVAGSLLGTAWFIGGLLLVTLMYTAIAAVAIIQGIILLIFSIRINRRSKYGNEQHAMWHAFKRFLADFSNLERAGIPSIIIWEHYLVYAISLGVAHEVIRQLPLVFRDEDLNQTGLTFLYGGMYGHFAGLNQMMDNTVRSVESAVITATQIASSSKSSGTGGGGGFSGGSSGGGGGGGGGGAF